MRVALHSHLGLGVAALSVLLGLIAPAPAAAVTVPQGVSFPATRTGAESSVTVSFAAEGGSELMGTAAVDGDAAFDIAGDTCSGNAVSGVCTVRVRFAPLTAGGHSATLRLGGARGDAAVALTGSGYAVGSKLGVSPAVVTFAPLSVGLLSPPQRVTVTAGGDLPTSIAGVAFEGPNPGDFVATGDGCTRTTLAPGTSCAIEVRANPSRVTGSFARVRVLTDPAAASVTVGLTVVPIVPPPPPPPPIVISPPWSLGIVRADHAARRTIVRLYTSLPTSVTVTLVRGRRTVRRSSRAVNAGLVRVMLKGRLKRGRYRVGIVGRRSSERRQDSIRLRVR